MGLFDGVSNALSTPKEKRTQLFFRDDGGFQFRRLDIEDGFLVERDKQRNIIKAWMLRYRLQKAFAGFGRIPSDKVTMSYGRDIMFDPFYQLVADDKIKKGPELRKQFVKNIAAAKCYRHEVDAKGSAMADKVIWFIGAIDVILAVALLVKVAT